MKLATKKILIIIDCTNFLVRIIMQKQISLTYIYLIMLNCTAKSHFINKKKQILRLNYYLCITYIPIQKTSKGRGWGRQKNGKSVFVRFGFDVQESGSSQHKLSKTKQRRLPHEVVYYILSSLSSADLIARSKGYSIYLHWREAYGVVRFDKLDDDRASTNE